MKESKSLRDHFSSYEVEPPVEVWTSIAANLDERKKRRLFFLLSGIAAALFVFASIGSIVYYITTQQRVIPVTSRNRYSPLNTRKDHPAVSSGNRNHDNNKHYTIAEQNVSKFIPVTPAEIRKIGVQKRDECRIQVMDTATTGTMERNPDVSLVVRLDHPAETSNDSVKLFLLPETQLQLLSDEPDSEESKKKSDRWDVGAQIAPLYSYRNTSASVSEDGIISYAGGVYVGYRAGGRWKFQMGISYSRSGLAIDNPSSYSDPQNGLLTSIGVVINNKVFANPPAPGGTTIQNFSYLDLPFIARYKFIDRKFDISLSGGIYTSFLMSSNAYVQTIDNQKNQIGQTDNVARFNYSGAVGIGLERTITKRLLFNIEPRFRYFFNSVNTTGNVSTHPFSFGLFSGVTYFF